MRSTFKVTLLFVVLLIAAVYSAPTPHIPSPAPSVNPHQHHTAAALSASMQPSPLVSPRARPVVAGPWQRFRSPLAWFLGVLGAIAVAVIGRVLGQLVLDWLEERRASNRLDKEPHTLKEIKRLAADKSSVYVQPDCQNNDPSSGEKAEQRRPLFAELDKLLGPPHGASCIMILADSGMGKSSLLHKYYGYHWTSSKRSRRFRLVVVRLNRRDVTAQLDRIPASERSETVLFLDALDEDRKAIANYEKRLQEIADLTAMFPCVVVTCRTQFFLKDADIHIHARSQQTSYTQVFGERAPLVFMKLYLSPFSSAQTGKYLRRRFLWRLHLPTYWLARRTAKRFADLIARPMLLTYIQNLVQAKKEISYSFEVYEVIVNEWLRWEVKNKLLARDATQLLEFSYKLAAYLFAQGRDRASPDGLRAVATAFSVELDVHEVQQRSLLNRDAEGNWKFAHRSIEEYLLVKECSVAKVPPDWTGQVWTDQMRQFAREMLLSGECQGLPGADLRCLNLTGVNFGRVLLVGARLEGADLTGANLGSVCGLSVPKVLMVRSDRKTRWPVHTLRRHRWAVHGCAVSPKGDYIVSASVDGTLKLWDPATGNELHKLTGHAEHVHGCAVSPKGDYIVSASWDNTLKV